MNKFKSGSATSMYHFGILGMKWGVRRKSGKSGRVTSEEHNKAQGLKKKHISEMSNDELRQLNTRLQLERSYKDLSKKEISGGKKFVADVLQQSGKQLASKYLSGLAETSIKNISYAINPNLIPTS